MLVPRSYKAIDFEPAVRKLAEGPRRIAPAVSMLLAPVTFTGYVLAFWRLAADLDWAGEFFVSQGLFSRWQVWLAMGIATQLAARELKRLGRPDGPAIP